MFREHFGVSFLAFCGRLLYGTRWLLVPLYLGMFPALFAYDIKFFQEILAMWFGDHKGDVLLTVIDMIDIIMITNLVVMIAVSGYSLFVRSYKDEDFEGTRPLWFHGDIDSSKQKIKLSVSLIGVSSVHLLHSFIEASKLPWDTIGKQIGIHATFLISTVILCYVDYMLRKADQPTEHH